MANQNKPNQSTEAHLVPDRYKYEYEQLSEDWRNRDRITWQLPAVLVVVGGLLLVAIFGELSVDPTVKYWLLWVGLSFVSILTFMLTRNLYLQTVGEDLMANMRKGPNQAEEAMKGAGRVPRRRKEYGSGEALKIWTKPSSFVLLMLLCPFIVGLFTFLLASYPDLSKDYYSQVWTLFYGWFIFGIAISISAVFLILWLSWLLQKVDEDC